MLLVRQRTRLSGPPVRGGQTSVRRGMPAPRPGLLWRFALARDEARWWIGFIDANDKAFAELPTTRGLRGP